MAQDKSIKILSNFQNFSSVLQQFSDQNGIRISYEAIPSSGQRFRAFRTFLKTFKKDILILNVEERLLYKLCFLKLLVPWGQCIFISVDLIMRAPEAFRKRLICRIKAVLFKKVNYFILYHKNVFGYNKYFNIDRQKCIYVPFKVNQLVKIRNHLFKGASSKDPSNGDYVIAAGRSLRDLNTFIKAMSNLNLPGMILRQDKSILAHHGTFLGYKSLPINIKEIVDYGSYTSFIHYIANAKVVVIPRFSRDINATGIGVYLMAMALKKCVIISHGPGTTELLRHDEAILVPPEDVNALSKAILRAWNQDEYRKRIAENGQKYAFSLKDEKRLHWDIVNVSYNLYRQYK